MYSLNQKLLKVQRKCFQGELKGRGVSTAVCRASCSGHIFGPGLPPPSSGQPAGPDRRRRWEGRWDRKALPGRYSEASPEPTEPPARRWPKNTSHTWTFSATAITKKTQESYMLWGFMTKCQLDLHFLRKAKAAKKYWKKSEWQKMKWWHQQDGHRVTFLSLGKWKRGEKGQIRTQCGKNITVVSSVTK